MTLRILHCPNSTGGNAWTLAQAEKKLGLESTVMVFSGTWFGYQSDIDLQMNRRSSLSKFGTLSSFLLKTVRDYDIVHFNFGESMFSRFPGWMRWLEQKDLPLLKAAGKGICVTYQGCDIRQKSRSVERFDLSACEDGHCGVCELDTDQLRARRATAFDRHADAIFALNPDLMWVLPERTEFLPYTAVDPAEWVPDEHEPSSGDGAFRILHAPTSQDIKGTRYVFEAVEALKRTHPEVELLLVENVPHAEVKDFYRRADLVIDQLLVGWYGALAVEAMALGKPVVCFVRESDLGFIPSAMRDEMPICNATPATLRAVLEALISDRQELHEIGRRGRRYVERWHDPVRVAAQTKAAYERIAG